jgi:hypothetical protein
MLGHDLGHEYGCLVGRAYAFPAPNEIVSLGIQCKNSWL